MIKKTVFVSILFFLLNSICFGKPPVLITLTAPPSGTFVNKTVPIEAQIDQIPRVKSVKFYIDNKLVGESDTAPYQYTWDTTSYPDGQHQIYASILQTPERPEPFDEASMTVLDSPKTNLMVDNTPPLVSITSPQNGFVSTTQTITVSGTIDDNQATVTVNGSPASVSNSAFTANNLTLIQGQNTITAAATDLAGNTSSASITVTYQPDNSGDTTPPSISIYTPDKDSTTRSNIIYGRVSDDTIRVTVNGIDTQLSNSTFIARPPLSEGQNTITIKAWDATGNLGQSQITFTYNTQTPKVTITSPLNNSIQNISPINVIGTNTTDLKYILIGSLPAHIDGGNFTVEGISLNSNYTVITAEGYDANDNLFEDSVFVTSPQLANYQFTEISGNAYEDDETKPVAGSTRTLAVTLEKNSQLALNEQIQFNIREGNGTLSQSYVFTDNNGIAQVVLTTDSSSNVINKVECFVSNNPLVKTTFVVYTKPGSPSNLTKITDNSVTPVPGATLPLIVKLTDQNNNPIPDENINFQITQGTGTLSATQALTTYYGETKVTLNASANPSETTQVIATSATNSNLSVTFNITTSPATTLTFNDIMAKVKQNEDKIQDLMADVTVTSNDPNSYPEEQFKLWMKGNKSKVQDLSPIQKTSIIETTSDSVKLNGQPFLSVVEGETDPNITRTDTIESSSGDIYVLKTVVTSTDGFEETTRYYVDYAKGVFVKTEDEYKDQDIKEFSEITYSTVLMGDIWVMNGTVTKVKDFLENQEYTTTETRSNIIINSGIPDSIFQ